MNTTFWKISICAAISPLLGTLSCTGVNEKKDAPAAAPQTDDPKDQALLESNQFRGYKIVNEQISRRLFNDEKFTLAHYIEDTDAVGAFAGFIGTIKDLLGVQKGSGLHSGFQSGTPNAMNMTVWYMALNGLAMDTKQICQSDSIGPFAASADFLATAKPVCEWPIHYSQRRKTLKKLWNVLMEFDASDEEFDAWFRFAGSPELRELAGEEALFQLTFAALYNPHFLIAK